MPHSEMPEHAGPNAEAIPASGQGMAPHGRCQKCGCERVEEPRFTFLTARELLDLPLERVLVELIDGCYSIHADNGHRYEFAKDRCETPAQLLSWVHHLTDKTWFTSRHAHQLIALANENGVTVDFGC